MERLADGSTKSDCRISPRWPDWRTKVSRSPPQDVVRITSGRSASRRVTSVEKSGAPKFGNISATTWTSGFSA